VLLNKLFRLTNKLRLRRLLFALIPLVFLLLILTVVFSLLEKEELIETERPDDRILYAPLKFIEQEKTEQGLMYVVRNPHMTRGRFPVKKPKNTFRVFVTGGSFALGTPYVIGNPVDDAYGGIPDWLQAELSWRYPDRVIEVINVSAGAQTTGPVMEIVKDVAALNADAIVVAAGNNDSIAPETVFNEALHKWIIYRVLKKTLLPEPHPFERPLSMPAAKDINLVERAFREHIDGMIRATRNHGVPLILCTLPINLRFDGIAAGLASTPDEPAFLAGDSLRKEKRYREALEQYAQSRFQGLAALRSAQCLEQLGRLEEAREMYRVSVQVKPITRMRPTYNQYVRAVTKQDGVYLADLAAAYERTDPARIGDPNLFVDNCHMTWRGYYQMAQVVLQAVDNARLLPASEASLPTMEALIEHNGWQALHSWHRNHP